MADQTQVGEEQAVIPGHRHEPGAETRTIEGRTPGLGGADVARRATPTKGTIMALGNFTAQVAAGYPNSVIEQVATVLQSDRNGDDNYVALVRRSDGTALLVTTSYGSPIVYNREFLEDARREHEEALASIDALLARFPA